MLVLPVVDREEMKRSAVEFFYKLQAPKEPDFWLGPTGYIFVARKYKLCIAEGFK